MLPVYHICFPLSPQPPDAGKLWEFRPFSRPSVFQQFPCCGARHLRRRRCAFLIFSSACGTQNFLLAIRSRNFDHGACLPTRCFCHWQRSCAQPLPLAQLASSAAGSARIAPPLSPRPHSAGIFRESGMLPVSIRVRPVCNRCSSWVSLGFVPSSIP